MSLATVGQIKHIQRLMFELGFKVEDVLCEYADTADLNCLTKEQARQLISELKKENGESEEMSEFEQEVEGL